MVQFYLKGINTLRRVLDDELGLHKHYQKYIQIHGAQINLENTSRLLIRCKLLLQGRKLLSQILMIAIERNNLVISLKEMVALD